MAVSHAQAYWEGSLKEGKGGMKTGSGVVDAPFGFGTRFEGAAGTNPEELIGAAHAGCFSMAFSAMLGGAGYTPERVQTAAEVKLEQVEGGFAITNIHLTMEAKIPGIGPEEFQEIAAKAKAGCPVSKALAGTNITLSARLL